MPEQTRQERDQELLRSGRAGEMSDVDDRSRQQDELFDSPGAKQKPGDGRDGRSEVREAESEPDFAAEHDYAGFGEHEDDSAHPDSVEKQ